MLFKILLLLFIAILPLKIMRTHAKHAKHYINGNIVLIVQLFNR
ncbi:hypothetical protein HMPREF1579_01158 [Gardnerella vaginalis JCP8066]|nr:hypothetical protein HMPREF1586_00804 [Gardnerella vaginalis JCP8522]EPI58595.1 hypothetical protein HMPREF1579_01158 [Gardnerella vaginalis JCP8066]